MPRSKKEAGRLARRRGIDYELEVVKVAKLYGFQARRNLQYQGGKSTGVDVEGLPIALGCRRRRTLPINRALIAALRDAEDEESAQALLMNRKPRLAAVATRGDYGESFIVMRLRDFFTLLKQQRIR